MANAERLSSSSTKTSKQAALCDLTASGSLRALQRASHDTSERVRDYRMKGISMCVDFLYSGYVAGKSRTMIRSSTVALYAK